MIKKILGIGIPVLIVLGAIWFYTTFMYVPKGETFRIKYTNAERLQIKGNPDYNIELTDHGIKSRSSFEKSGEEIIYKFEAVNDGTLDAVLKYDPIFLKADMYSKKHIEYKITYLDDTEIKAGDILKSGETATFKMKIRYTTSDFATQNSQFYETNTWLVYVRK